MLFESADRVPRRWHLRCVGRQLGWTKMRSGRILIRQAKRSRSGFRGPGRCTRTPTRSPIQRAGRAVVVETVEPGQSVSVRSPNRLPLAVTGLQMTDAVAMSAGPAPVMLHLSTCSSTARRPAMVATSGQRLQHRQLLLLPPPPRLPMDSIHIPTQPLLLTMLSRCHSFSLIRCRSARTQTKEGTTGRQLHRNSITPPYHPWDPRIRMCQC